MTPKLRSSTGCVLIRLDDKAPSVAFTYIVNDQIDRTEICNLNFLYKVNTRISVLLYLGSTIFRRLYLAIQGSNYLNFTNKMEHVLAGVCNHRQEPSNACRYIPYVPCISSPVCRQWLDDRPVSLSAVTCARSIAVGVRVSAMSKASSKLWPSR